MPPTKLSKHTKQSRVKARGQASRQQACGEREGQSLSHRGSSPNATQRISWANKAPTERGQSIRPKQDKKRRNDTGSAVNNGGGKPPPYTYGAGNSPRKERTHFPRTALPVCGRELPASSSRTAIAFSAVVAQSPRDRVSIFKAQKYAGGREGNTPIKREPPARKSKCAKQIRCTQRPYVRRALLKCAAYKS